MTITGMSAMPLITEKDKNMDKSYELFQKAQTERIRNELRNSSGKETA